MRSDALKRWVQAVAEQAKPEAIRWCDGSALEARSLEDRMIADGTLTRLNEQTHPRSFLHRSHPTDVARTEHLTFICSNQEIDAGPTNNWMSPEDAERKVWPLFAGAISIAPVAAAVVSETRVAPTYTPRLPRLLRMEHEMLTARLQEEVF
jgi:phosphoenolpyruvate carboxykinase (GTP)